MDVMRDRQAQEGIFGTSGIAGMAEIRTWWYEGLRMALWGLARPQRTIPSDAVRRAFAAVLPPSISASLSATEAGRAVQVTPGFADELLRRRLDLLLGDLVRLHQCLERPRGYRVSPIAWVCVPTGQVVLSGTLPTGVFPETWHAALQRVGPLRHFRTLPAPQHDLPLLDWRTWLGPPPRDFMAIERHLRILPWQETASMAAFSGAIGLHPALNLWLPLRELPEGITLMQVGDETTRISYHLVNIARHHPIAWEPRPTADPQRMVYYLCHQSGMRLQARLSRAPDELRCTMPAELPAYEYRGVLSLGYAETSSLMSRPRAFHLPHDALPYLKQLLARLSVQVVTDPEG
jgi:hypothetical protein